MDKPTLLEMLQGHCEDWADDMGKPHAVVEVRKGIADALRMVANDLERLEVRGRYPEAQAHNAATLGCAEHIDELADELEQARSGQKEIS